MKISLPKSISRNINPEELQCYICQEPIAIENVADAIIFYCHGVPIHKRCSDREIKHLLEQQLNTVSDFETLEDACFEAYECTICHRNKRYDTYPELMKLLAESIVSIISQFFETTPLINFYLRLQIARYYSRTYDPVEIAHTQRIIDRFTASPLPTIAEIFPELPWKRVLISRFNVNKIYIATLSEFTSLLKENYKYGAYANGLAKILDLGIQSDFSRFINQLSRENLAAVLAERKAKLDLRSITFQVAATSKKKTQPSLDAYLVPRDTETRAEKKIMALLGNEAPETYHNMRKILFQLEMMKIVDKVSPALFATISIFVFIVLVIFLTLIAE